MRARNARQNLPQPVPGPVQKLLGARRAGFDAGFHLLAGFCPVSKALGNFRFASGGDAAMRCPVVRQGRNMTRERFFGGSPADVILKLAIASIIIGVVLSLFGFDPANPLKRF